MFHRIVEGRDALGIDAGLGRGELARRRVTIDDLRLAPTAELRGLDIATVAAALRALDLDEVTEDETCTLALDRLAVRATAHGAKRIPCPRARVRRVVALILRREKPQVFRHLVI